MREIRLSGSEGGETAIKAVFPTPIKRLFFAAESICFRTMKGAG